MPEFTLTILTTLMMEMGPSKGGVRRGSGEARAFSDFEVKKSISISLKLATKQKRRKGYIFINYLKINELRRGGACGKD